MSRTAPEELSLHQFTAIAIGGRALLLRGPSGCGKTGLALSLIDRGAILIGDDGIALSVVEQKLIASPAPATDGLIEIRGVGIATMKSVSAPVSLILNFNPEPPRYIEATDVEHLLGHAVPVLQFGMGSPVDAIRAEYALSLHGVG